MTNATKQIESTGQLLTIGQREREARRGIVNMLARAEQQLWTLGCEQAAKFCRAAIQNITVTPPPKESDNGPRTERD